jgi:hypothetical protein
MKMKTLSSRLLLAIGLAAGMVGSAHASAVLATAPAAASYGDSYLSCSIVNGSDVAPAVVTVDGLAYDGSVVFSNQQKFLSPKQATIVQMPGSGASCRFTVLAGSRKAIHGAAIYVRNAIGNVDMVVPAR